MHKTTKTAVYGGGFFLNEELFPNLQSLHEALDKIDPEKEYSVHQQRITEQDLVRSLKIGKRLGNGAYGTAFLANCHYFGGPCVVKFPTALLRNKRLIIRENKLIFNRLIDVDQNTHSDFEKEKKNLFKVLTPEKMLESHAHFFEEGRLNRIHKRQYENLRKDAANFKRHSGYTFIHQFLHIDEKLYCIISEPCQGDVFSLLENHRLESIENKKAFFIQVGLAIHYMLFVLRVAHTDIKPDNIFWTRESGQFIFKVSDFGYLDDINALLIDPHHENDEFVCTDWYLPRLHNHPSQRRYNTPKLMLYTFFSTVLQVLNPREYSPDVQVHAFTHHGNIFRYPPQFQWLEQLNRVASPDMHAFMYSFLGKALDFEYWIYPGKAPQSWMHSFHRFFNKLIKHHNDTSPHQPYSIHI